MNTDTVRDLVQDAWAMWDQPIPPRLAKAPAAMVDAELDRRRCRARDRCAADLRELDRLEGRIRDTRGTLL